MVINVSFIDKNVKVISYKRRKKSLNDILNKNNDKVSNDGNISNDNNNVGNNENIKTINENKEIDDSSNNLKISENEINKSEEGQLESPNTNITPASDKTAVNNIEPKTGNKQKKNKVQGKNTLKFEVPVTQDSSINTFIDTLINSNIFPKNFISSIRSEKKFLVLPDELIGFDNLTLPSLKPWRVKDAIKLKMGVEYKNFESLNMTYKAITKIKPNIIYTLQLVQQKQLLKIIEYFRRKGIKIKGANFYSGCLCDFYTTHLIFPKSGAIIVRIEEDHTTILAISRGFLILSYSLACGEKDLIQNTPYRFDEHSKKMFAYKYICYELDKMSVDSSKKKDDNAILTIEQVEKSFTHARTNLLAPIFQPRNVGCREVVAERVEDMVQSLKNSEFNLNISRVVVDTKNEELFDLLKIYNSINIGFSERQIFERNRQNLLMKFKKIKSLKVKKFSWRDLWKKEKKEE